MLDHLYDIYIYVTDDILGLLICLIDINCDYIKKYFTRSKNIYKWLILHFFFNLSGKSRLSQVKNMNGKD